MYPMIGEPPSCSGGCHDNSTNLGPSAVISGAFVGAPGHSEEKKTTINRMILSNKITYFYCVSMVIFSCTYLHFLL
jgi:hypothetical protein